MNRLIKLILVLCFFQFFMLKNEEIFAQDGAVTKQIWLDYNPSYKFSKKLTFSLPVGARTIFPNIWYRFYVGPVVKFDWPRMIFKNLPYKENLLAGVSFYYTENLDFTDRLEIRPFQGYSLTAPNRERIAIKHYLKLEERFELQTDDWDNTFGLRLRYEASVTIRFQGDLWKYGKGFYLPINAEFFWNLIGTKQFNDNLRIAPGLGRHINESWKAAFFVGYNYTRSSTNSDFHTNNIIFRLRVYHKFKPKPQKIEEK